MFRFLARLIASMALALFAGALAAGNAGSILVLGDSIGAGYGLSPGAGWVDLLAREVTSRKYTVINASIPGDTTEGGKLRLPSLLAEHRPDIVLVELGGNDGLRGFPLEITRENLAQIIKAAQDAGSRVVLVGMRIPPNYGPRYTEGFHAIYADLAAQYRTALVPFLLAGIAGDPAKMQDDGIHPTAAAQPELLAEVLPVLEPLLGTP